MSGFDLRQAQEAFLDFFFVSDDDWEALPSEVRLLRSASITVHCAAS
jgi:hypothetical protein